VRSYSIERKCRKGMNLNISVRYLSLIQFSVSNVCPKITECRMPNFTTKYFVITLDKKVSKYKLNITGC